MSSDQFEQDVMAALSLALEVPSHDRRDWVETHYADQAELKVRLLKLLEFESSASVRLRTGGAGEDAGAFVVPERAGQYRITGLIGKGGMGAVYKGERDAGDFDHVAAIKIIRPGLFTDALIERFERERQTLADLNHPGITKLFDGGKLPDGTPYFVMELVDGVSLAQWIERQPRTQESAIRLFQKICDAVAHAHQNLIVHRDLTPSNVLVTDGDEIKLIDFGIAKPQSHTDLRADAGETSLASLSFTPGFAAPERQQGAPANTLSDVYSLGKLLESMFGDGPIDRDLDAIVKKASAFAPEDRYPSVLALQEDLRNYMGLYPVEARGPTTLYRFGKYLRRRRILVASGVAIVTALTGAFGLTFVQYQRADAALVEANARFEQARELSRALVFEAYDEFAEVSGTLEPRKRLADLLTEYVEQLAEGAYVPEDVLFDVGQMNSRLADIYGGLGIANLGDTEKSIDLLKQAETALSRVLEIDPENSGALAELLFVQRGLTMQTLIYRLDPAGAMTYNAQVLDGAVKGVALKDENEQTLLRHFWSARTDRLQILLETGDLEVALEDVRLWRSELTPEMFERLGGGEEMASYLAAQEAEILVELERPEEAIAPLQYAQSYRQERLRVEPGNYYEMTQLVVIYIELSRAYDLSGQLTLAVSNGAEAVELARRILAQDATDVAGIEGLNAALQNQAIYLFKSDDLETARRAADEAIMLARKLDEDFPGDPYYQRILMNTLITVGTTSASQSSACASLSEATELSEILFTGEAAMERSAQDTKTKLADLAETRNCVN